jgi:hypothetical protein
LKLDRTLSLTLATIFFIAHLHFWFWSVLADAILPIRIRIFTSSTGGSPLLKALTPPEL